MLETIDLDATVSKEEHRKRLETLDLELGRQQRELRATGIPVVIVFEGWDAAGKGTVLSRLVQALDPRGFKVFAIGPRTPEEVGRPPMWRFWTRLPARGAIAIFERSWYRQLLEERFEDDMPAEHHSAAIEHIRRFESQLVADGTVVVKFFLHISKKEQSKRFDEILKQPEFAWKIGKEQLRQQKKYKTYSKAVEEMLTDTSTVEAPWIVVPATNRRYVEVSVMETLSTAFENALHQVKAASPAKKPSRKQVRKRTGNPLDKFDMGKSIAPEQYKSTLDRLQEEVRKLHRLCYLRRRAVVIAYEGWDAAGKGGNIRRLTSKMDARGYEVAPVAAPQGDEKTHPYLWRFWKSLPKPGHITIFDRSWYGRVLVERVEGFAKPEEWIRSYDEINEFEGQLVESGIIVIKFWIHITKDEQMKRFTERQKNPDKTWKITDEDWRNRKKWNEYWEAVSDMLEFTSTRRAPWTVIEGNDKYYARVKALKTVIDQLSKTVPKRRKPRK